MKLLGIETATLACSVAVSDGGHVLATMTVAGRDRPSDHLMASIEHCVRLAGWSASALDGIAVSAGPGSFTGIRVGVTAAKMLAYVLGKPVAAVSSLDVVAANVPSPRWPLWVLVDARKEKLYAACYDPSSAGHPSSGRVVPRRVGPEQLITLEQLLPQLRGDVVVLGDGLVRYGAQIRAAVGERGCCLPPELWVPQASAVCRLGALAFAAGRGVSPHALVPQYLYSQESDITGW